MNALDILMSQNETIGAEQDKLQQLAAEPVQQSFRNPGQTGFDMLKNPDANQSRALLEGALAMLNSNPANPAQGFSSGISAGLNLNKQMKEEQRDQQLKAQDYKVGGAESQFDRTLGIIRAMPQPDEPTSLQRVQVQYMTPEGSVARDGYAAWDPKTNKYYGENNQQLAPGTFRPLTTGRSPQDLMHGLPKPPQGYKWKEDASGLEKIDGGPADKTTVEAGGKAGMVATAQQNLTKIDDLLFGKDEKGNVDRNIVNDWNVLASRIPGTDMSVPLTDGRTLDVLYRDSIEAKIRLESGAAVPEPEIVRANVRFRPSVLDSDETVRVKRDMLERYFNNAESYYDPTDSIGDDSKRVAVLNEKGRAFFAEVDREVQMTKAAQGPRPPAGVSAEVWEQYTPEQQQRLRVRLGE